MGNPNVHVRLILFEGYRFSFPNLLRTTLVVFAKEMAI